MAKDKKSFILYCDQRGVFDKLSDQEAGKLIKHIFAYVSDESPEGDFVTELAFELIKQQLKRDLKTWEQRQEQRRQAGLKSAEIRKRNAATVQRDLTTVNDRLVSSTVNGNVNDTVNGNVNENEIKEIPKVEDFIAHAKARKPKVKTEAVRMKYYEWLDNGWNTLGDKSRPIKNWKSTLTNSLKYMEEIREQRIAL